jgi:hypothetical protein
MGMLARARASCPRRQEPGRRPTGVQETVTGGATIAAISGSAHAPRCTAIVVVAQSASAIVASKWGLSPSNDAEPRRVARFPTDHPLILDLW